MIIWQGLGLLAVLIPIAMYALTVKVLQLALGVAYTDTHSWPGALGTILGAALVYLLAMRLDAPGRTLVDQRTGQTVIIKRKHTLFWVPMHILAMVLAAVGLGMLLLKSGSPL